MKIYIMRHGEASYQVSSDSKRELTQYGKEQCQHVADWLKQQHVHFDLALVSPYIRAQQSFSVLSKTLPVKRVETNEYLVPGGSASHIVNQLLALDSHQVKSVIVVSHLPLVGYLVSELCPHLATPMFSTADVACISLSCEGSGKVEWFYPPK